MPAQIRHVTFAEVKEKKPSLLQIFEGNEDRFFIVTEGSFVQRRRTYTVGEIIMVVPQDYAETRTWPGDEHISRPVVTGNGVEQYQGQAMGQMVWGFVETLM